MTAVSHQPANRQIVFDGPGRVSVHEVVPDRDTIGRDEVVLETECSLISAGTETSVLHRGHGDGSAWAGMQDFPFQPGYSNVGTVTAAGSAARHRLGERASSHAPHAAIVRVPASELRTVPAGVASPTAALCSLGEVALNGVRRSGVGIGARCVVLGLGLVGQITARLLAVAGAAEVWCLDPDHRRRALVPDRPRFRLDEDPPADAFDVAVEASGHPAAMARAGQLVRAGGTIGVVSSPSAPTTFDFHDACNRKSVTIVGSHYFSHPPAGQRGDARENGECFLDLVEHDPAVWDGLVTEHVAVADAPARYSTMISNPPVAGVLLRW